MAQNLTNYLENELLEHSVGKSSWTTPAATYAALYTVMPTESGDGTPVSGGSYARQAITWGSANDGVIANSVAIIFPTASADWGTVVGLAVLDASTGGNMLWFGPLTTPRTVNNADVFSIAIGQLSLALE